MLQISKLVIFHHTLSFSAMWMQT